MILWGSSNEKIPNEKGVNAAVMGKNATLQQEAAQLRSHEG